ncbi:pilus assembly protein [Citrobacter meridianamericanus]|uniref:Pilus assembly protein n=1 Tax=Citrobacter meridianamericanus TaxID=2894201 RepID=A0ABT1B3B6_9ENTR|nr:pilus assembly protein [Citrobacter meridianamericanus]MCO5780342.1 pilus assembly protein [Citrobacter meridianamericanus]
MKMYNKFHIRRFIRGGNAGVSIMFAIILPVLIATFSLGIDGSRFLIKRARLADALSQGSFAVASTNSNLTTEPEKIEGKELVKSYINYYIPSKELDESTLAVSANIDVDPDDSTKVNSIEYVATAKIIAHPIIDGISRALPGFNKNVPIIADENNGIVRKTIGGVNVESDIVFAVDFSGSMLTITENGKTRIGILREVVIDLATQIDSEKSKSKISIVPFDIAIPIKLEEKNEAGGDRIGCLMPYKLKSTYQIDYSFWANKKVDWKFSLLNDAEVSREEFVKRYLDLKRYDYYSKIISLALWFKDGVWGPPSKDYTQFCTTNTAYDSLVASGKLNSNPLSCEANELVSVTSSPNLAEIKNSYKVIEDYYISMEMNKYSGVVSSDFIDYSGTLSDSHLFNERAMSLFEAPFASISMGNLFKNACMSGFNINSKMGISIPAGHPSGTDDYYQVNLSSVRQNAYVIPLTNEKQEIAKINNMTPVFNASNAATDIISGLLYSAHEVVKGDNPRKIIVIVTDGATLDDMKKIESNFLASGICKKISDGILRKSSTTKEVKIFFVSIYNDQAVLSDWRKNCVGDDGAFIATDYSELKNVITDVLNQEPGGLKFINKSDMIVP